ncbi:hypothetical protein B566_EDAN008597 [Ephemera danica]|nr:hypothetical protein B566_EDAN008597 [Ephemera danica]
MTFVRSCAVRVLLLVALAVHPLDSSPPCDHYGGPRCNYPFLPAPPGRTPSCGKGGNTFCEKIEHYPMQLIRYLIERWGYDYNTLLSDESRDEFTDRVPKPLPQLPTYHYGAPAHHPPHNYHAKVVPVYYPQSRLMSNYTGQQQQQQGYPDRRYRFDSPASTPYYTGPYLTTLLPGPYTPSESWWTRYSRAAEEVKQRTKRQSGGGGTAPAGATQLCPVTSSFVMPRAALNNRGNWMYVVNLNEVDDRYTQLVRSETCASNQCNGLCSIPNGYTSSCQQQYVQKRLIALEGSGDRLYTDVFWFPHCCICQIVPSNG